LNKLIEAQRIRYDREAKQHALHYNDVQTQNYRDRFIRSKLFKESLVEKNILDAMSASGIETGYLQSKGAIVVGLDISKNNAREYRKRWSLNCIEASIHETGITSNSYDAVYVCGGLHHILFLLKKTLFEIHRILKPGGLFYFVEPNKATFIDRIRTFWYKKDARFEMNEQSIDYEKTLKPYLKIGFQEERLFYGGNIAYLFVGQSLVIGMPQKIKLCLARPLFILEKWLDKVPWSPKLFFAGAWKKS
jgi:SAM-dependent methyltransferase